jgi:GNAT superfamily N-acetyltransferase
MTGKTATRPMGNPARLVSTPDTVSVPDRHRAIATIVAAFAADPIVRWFYNDPAQYLSAFTQFVTAYSEHAFGQGSVFNIDDFTGVAIWYQPGDHADENEVAEVLQRTIDPARQEAVFRFFEELETYFPGEPVWYLPFIGVDPARQGQGHGAALLAHTLDMCDAQGVPAYLEATSERSMTLYQRNGFQVVGRVQVADSPPAWPMLRKRG